MSPHVLLCVSPCLVEYLSMSSCVSEHVLLNVSHILLYIFPFLFVCLQCLFMRLVLYCCICLPLSLCMCVCLPMSYHVSPHFFVVAYVCMSSTSCCMSPSDLLYVSQWLVICLPMSCGMSPRVLWNVSIRYFAECLGLTSCWVSWSYVLLYVSLCLVECLPSSCCVSTHILLYVSPVLCVSPCLAECLCISCCMSHVLFYVSPRFLECLPVSPCIFSHALLNLSLVNVSPILSNSVRGSLLKELWLNDSWWSGIEVRNRVWRVITRLIVRASEAASSVVVRLLHTTASALSGLERRGHTWRMSGQLVPWEKSTFSDAM